METKMVKILLNGLLLLAFSSEIKAEIFQISDYNLSARGAGLRNTDVAMSAQSSSVFANPALLVDIKLPSGGSSVNRGFGNLTSVYGVYPTADFTFGGGIAYLNYGEIRSYTDQSLQSYTEFSPYELMIAGSVAKNIYPNLNAGLNVKYYSSKIDKSSSSALGMDLACTYKMLDDKFTIAGGIFNLGNQLDAFYDTKEDMPLTVKGGISNQFIKLPLELSAQYNYSVHGESWYSAGMEFKPKPNLHLRAGYDFTADDKEIGTATQSEKFAGLALGGSVIFKYFAIDMAYQINGELEENWTFAINSWLLAKQESESRQETIKVE